MVKKGEFLERPALIEAGELWLEGLFHRGKDKPGLLVCPPIAGEIGMDAPAVAELAFATSQVGRASLRFQHRGFGASHGSPDPTRSVDDARFALAHLLACIDSPRLDVAGYRSGALTALSLTKSEPRIRGVVLIAPQTLLDLEPISHRRALVVLGALSPEAEIEAWRARVDAHPDAELVLIEEADFRFVRGLTKMGQRVVAWLEASRELFAGADDELLPASAPRTEERVGEGEDEMIIER